LITRRRVTSSRATPACARCADRSVRGTVPGGAAPANPMPGGSAAGCPPAGSGAAPAGPFFSGWAIPRRAGRRNADRCGAPGPRWGGPASCLLAPPPDGWARCLPRGSRADPRPALLARPPGLILTVLVPSGVAGGPPTELSPSRPGGRACADTWRRNGVFAQAGPARCSRRIWRHCLPSLGHPATTSTIVVDLAGKSFPHEPEAAATSRGSIRGGTGALVCARCSGLASLLRGPARGTGCCSPRRR